MQDNNPTFTFNYNYTYSLRETAEIQKIRDKYRLTREETDFEQLKKLDRATCRRAKIIALIICAAAAALSVTGTVFTVLRRGEEVFSIFGRSVTKFLIIGVSLIFLGFIIACTAEICIRILGLQDSFRLIQAYTQTKQL